MHRFARLVLAAPLLLGVLASGCTGAAIEPPVQSPSAESVTIAFFRDLDTLVTRVEQLDGAARVATPDSADGLRTRYVAARSAYKRVEFLVEHFSPATAEGINGPALVDMAEDDPNRTAIPPEGFQVVEEFLYPEATVDDCEGLRIAAGVLLANVRRARYNARATPLTDAAILDAVRLQLLRTVSLGLAGFDSPIALRGVDEAAETIRGLADVLDPYITAARQSERVLADTLAVRLARAESSLKQASPDGFNAFDRLAFIVGHAVPLGESMLALQSALQIPQPQVRRAWRPSVATPFARGAFDALAFAPAPHVEATADEEALGRTLFFDPVLSRDGTRACASCHQPSQAFADTLATSLATVSDARTMRRNAPTVVNSALQGATFADLRTSFLEDQVADVVGNVDEMHGSLEGATAAVRARGDYRRAFARAFPAGGPAPDSAAAVTPLRLRRALASYLRSLEALDARFDRYVRGDRGAMNEEERAGFNVFMGKGRCGTCHFAPLFNGVVPPLFLTTESEVIGVPVRAVTRGATIDPDSGRARVTRLPIHLHAFKTPGLRNVALSAPYMHNGAYRTLEEVVEFYNLGGGVGIGITLPNQTLPFDSLALSTAEQRSLVAFMHALTDTTSVPGMGRLSAGPLAGVAPTR